MKMIKLFAVILLSISVTYSAPAASAPKDARNTAKAFASLKPTQYYQGYYNIPYTAIDGQEKWESGNFQAKIYGTGPFASLKIYYMADNQGKVIYDNREKPLDKFPYFTAGTPTGFHGDLYGYDDQGTQTIWGECHLEKWLPKSPIAFKLKPSSRMITIKPRDLNYDPLKAGIVIEEWGDYLYHCWDSTRQAYVIWVDPTEFIHYRIVMDDKDRLVLDSGTIEYGLLPEPPDNPGSFLGFRYQDNVIPVVFDDWGMLSENASFLTTVTQNGKSTPAAVYFLDRSQIEGKEVTVGFGNFAGRYTAEITYDGLHYLKVVDKVVIDYNHFQYPDALPAGTVGIVLSFIKEPVAIEPDPENSNPDLDHFYLTIGKPVPTPPTGGSGGGKG